MNKISTKIKRKFKKSKNNTIIDLSEIKSAKGKLSEIDSDIQTILMNEKYDPSHAIYLIAQNLLSYFTEDFSTFIEFSDFYDKVTAIEDEFMPSGPPMSPLTKSYFTFWCFCDLSFGDESETICSIFYDLAEENEFDEMLLKAVKTLNSSYMGLYKHMGFEDDFILLKEILTNKLFRCICPTGYKGKKNEIWFIRIVKNLDDVYDYLIVMNTPYIILNSKEQDWIAFFQRQGITNNDIEYEKKRISFLKNNPDFKYWHNYIMDAYVNHSVSNILLTGIPDIKGSKPHEL